MVSPQRVAWPAMEVSRAHARFGQRRKTPNEPAAIAKLRELGVLSWKLDADKHEKDPKLEATRKARNYSYKVMLHGRPLTRSMRNSNAA